MNKLQKEVSKLWSMVKTAPFPGISTEVLKVKNNCEVF